MSSRELTQDELVAELTERFGPNPADWAFQCPSCGTVTTGADMRAALDKRGLTDKFSSEYLGQECIGRIDADQGCDWCAFGLFRGPWMIVMPDDRKVGCFPIAPATKRNE